MAFDWLTGGNLPQFWKNYVSLFDSDDVNFNNKRYIIFDMETSGLDLKEDVILSIGAIGIKNNAIDVGDFFEVHIKQDMFNAETTIQDGFTGPEKVVEAEAMIRFLNFAKDAVLVGHNVNLDIEMINQALKRLDLGRVKNIIMDTNALYSRWKGVSDDNQATLDELTSALKIKKSDRHTASGNAFVTALVFLKLKTKLGI